MNGPRRVYFVREIAQEMRMGPSTVYKHIHAGSLKAEQNGTGKNSIRVPREAFENRRSQHELKTFS